MLRGKKGEVLRCLEHWSRRMSKPICLPGLKTLTAPSQPCETSASLVSPSFHNCPCAYLSSTHVSILLSAVSLSLFVCLSVSFKLFVYPASYLSVCLCIEPPAPFAYYSICLSLCLPVCLSLGKIWSAYLPMTLGLDCTWQTWHFSSTLATCRLNG